jgi:hypothetical protein
MANIKAFQLPPIEFDGEPHEQSARIHYTPTHGQTKEFVRRAVKARNDEDVFAIYTAGVLVLVADWVVYDVDTHELLPFTIEGIERADQAVIDALFTEATKTILHLLPN